MVPDTVIIQAPVVKQVAAFEIFLRRHGYEMMETKPWELLRWQSPHGDGARMVYTNKRGQLGRFSSHEAEQDWFAWRDDECNAPREALAPAKPAPKSREPVQSKRGPFTLTRYDGAGYVGCDVQDEAGRWIANIHGTSNGKPMADYERNVGLFVHSRELRACLEALQSYTLDVPDELAAEITQLLESTK